MEYLQGLNHWIVSLISTLFVTAMTQVISNVAAITFTQPILLALVRKILSQHFINMYILASLTISRLK